MNSYPIGATVRISTTSPFTVGATPTDPTTVTLTIRKGDGAETDYTYADGEVTRSSAGSFYKDVLLDVAGVLSYRWTGTGAAAAVDEDSLYVRAGAVAYP